LTLNLYDDVVVTAVRDRLVDKVKGSSTWIGHVEGEEHSEVFLTVRGNIMSGTISIGENLYEVQYIGNDLHEINQIDTSKNPDDVERFPDIEETSSSDIETSREFEAASTSVDVMVLYTAKARNNAGGTSGMLSRIDNAVEMANHSYINSKVDMQINLVHAAEVDYVETGDIIASHDALTYKTDGHMDYIHAWRDKYGADMVVLISTDTNACGVAWTMRSPSTSFESRAFAVVKDTCISQHTFAHELGHVQGNQHNRANSSNSGAYDYSYGYRLCQTGGFRTVMSYACSGGTRVGYFSNPNVTYNGEYTGTPTDDNARSMNNTKSIVSAFRSSADTSTPAAPSNLTASALSDTEITISWADNSDNEIGFRLERSIDAKSWYEFAVVGSNVKSFTDTGLAAATTYYYRVRVYNSNGNSSYSNTVSSTTKNAVVASCVYSNPALTMAPSTLYTLPGVSVAYSISLTNKDSSACGASTFTLTNSDG
ncbi:MAG: fibronectin type III domain-containing protein, partial [Methylomicrobium sp.]|nr:fibronectin type III domain-containing protein [Methylomicrobium sp.]